MRRPVDGLFGGGIGYVVHVGVPVKLDNSIWVSIKEFDRSANRSIFAVDLGDGTQGVRD